MKKFSRMKKSYLFLFTLVLGIIFQSCGPNVRIDNPYENVDWQNHLRLKANLHTHTTRSDGSYSPQKVVDSYHNLDYKILAITDHNEVTFPWEGFSELNFSKSAQEKLESGRIDSSAIIYQNRNAKELKMYAIQGNEVSAPHHLGSYFNDYQQEPGDEKVSIEEIGAKNGIILLNHPGRYTKRNPEKYNVGWYVDIFNQYDYVTGMEVYNQGDRYQNDRELWDAVLEKTMPERPIWGYSNDDFHRGENALGRNWNLFILPDLNEQDIRSGMLEGRFLYVYAQEGHKGPKVPEIESIEVNNKKGMIEIQSSGQDSIRWISAGKVVARGNSIKIAETANIVKYVRAEIFGSGSITGTQPFGIQ